VRVGQVLQQQRARLIFGADDAVAAHQAAGWRRRRDLRVEAELSSEERAQCGVEVATRLLADQRGGPGAAVVAETQSLDRREERCARRFDGGLDDVAAGEAAACAERLGETLGGQGLIGR
jgi:hypothetical protein